MPHINVSWTVWDGSGEINLSKLNSLYCCAAKLLIPEEKIFFNRWKTENSKHSAITETARLLQGTVCV